MFHEAAHRDPTGMEFLNDCERCMQNRDRLTRQANACGYEPPAPAGIFVSAWKPDNWKGADPAVCPGYTTNLPEVNEIAHAHSHWDKGVLRDYCGGVPTEEMLTMIEVFDCAISQMRNARDSKP